MLILCLITMIILCTAIITHTEPEVICKDAGAGGYQAFPDVTRLRNGELICVFYAGYGHVSLPGQELPRGGRIVSMRSSDEGKSWSKPETVVDTPIDDRDPHINQLSDDTLVISFFTRLESGDLDVYFTRSHDLGKSWESPVCICRGVACSAKISELQDKTLILPVYQLKRTETGEMCETAVIRSTDFGATWSEPIFFPNSNNHSHDETELIELPNGKLLALIRPCMCKSTSEDGGKTWSEPQQLNFEGHCPCLLRTSKGVLLLAHRLPNTAMHYSLDDGTTWNGPIELDSVFGAYQGMVELSDGQILVIYYEEGPHSAIRQIRCHL